MRFDRKGDPTPLPVGLAISRGQLLVNGPVQGLLLAGAVVALLLFDRSTLAGSLAMALGFVLAWLWWSFYIPEWRDWAHERGADPEELQEAAIRSKLTWPKGSFFERTEMRRRKR